MRENERERLYYLFQERKCPMHFLDNKEILDTVDYLLENGVVVPTIAIDDTVYRIGQDDRIYEWQIAYIHAYKDEIVYIDDSDNYIFESDIGKTVFLSREDAERALKGDEGK